MSFVMLCPGGGEIIILALLLLVPLVGACLAAAIFTTIGLAKWAAARHNRLAAKAR